MPEVVKVREATLADMAEVAAVFGTSRREALPFLPVLHTAQEDIDYFSNIVVNANQTNQVFVAVDDSRIVGFIAFDDEWVHHLYLLSSHQRMGIGASLLDLAKKHSLKRNNLAEGERPSLRLWVFQKNHAAREFYTRHGFRVLQETDGSDNEEKEPDVLLEWS